MHHNVPIAILEEAAPATVTPEVEISGAGVVNVQEMALGKCVQYYNIG